MSLDQFSLGISSSTSHPKGEFIGMIRDVKVVPRKDGSGKLFLFDIKTDKGLPPSVRIGWVTEDDFGRAENLNRQGDSKPLKDIEMQIRILKHTLVKLNVVDEKTVNTMPYSACVKSLGGVKGKSCRILVKEQKNNPQYDQTDFLFFKDEQQVAPSFEQPRQAVSSPSNGFSVDEVPF